MTHASPHTDRHCFGCDRPMINPDYCQSCGEYYPGPLGVECWRLLFRAHRDGWRLINDYHRPGLDTRHRQYCNGTTGLTFSFSTKRPVR